ncbi:MAG: PTS sugar transporter subunit IIA [Erysipelotrichaceae bacterium]|nr:PTS sugar transporter subunit IIA [Erysipelotrichaceae bacterium]
MKGIIIASHGDMAKGMLETTKLFFGEQPQIQAYCLQASDNPDEFVERLEAGIKEVDTGDGVVVFCDMLFGSPCNCMMRILGLDFENPKLDVITGVNLAMVLQMLSTREAGDVDIPGLLDAGVQGIADLKAIIKANLGQ